MVNEYPTLDGSRWKASGLGLKRPRPVQAPRPPIWVGGSSPAALRRTARYADGWLPQSLGPNADLLDRLRALREEYRDGAPLDIGGIADFLHVGSPPATAELPPGTVSGPPEALAEYLTAVRRRRRGQVQVRFPAPLGATELCDQVAAFGAEVIPLVGS